MLIEPKDHEPLRAAEHLLADHLRVHGYAVQVLAKGFIVRRQPEDARCVWLACRSRVDDGARPWFFDSSGPVAAADQVMDAVTAVKGLLG